jgi:menaquinone-dependent protoporphyrinogen oxidase
MCKPILVAYTTRHGSTQEVAEVIAATLRGQGFPAEAQPATSISSLAPYDAVILGTALYMGFLHHDAKEFLRNHHEALQHRPAAFFALAPVYAEDRDWVAATEQARRELARFPWFVPVSHQIFAGTYHPGTASSPFQFVPSIHDTTSADHHDWDAIHAWTYDQLIPSLQQAHVYA